MQTVIKLFIFAAIYVIGIANLAKTNTVWTGDLSYRLIHLLLFITSVLALISRMRPKAGQNLHPLYPVARWCFIIVCLFYALTYLSAIFITDLPLLLK